MSADHAERVQAWARKACQDGKTMPHMAPGMIMPLPQGCDIMHGPTAWTEAQKALAVGMLDLLDKYGEDELEDCVPASMKDLRHAMRRVLRKGVPLAIGMRGPLVSFVDWTERVHEAFGAPGDWGYDSTLGQMLNCIYQAVEIARPAEGVKA